MYHGLSRWYFRSRLRWIETGTARSVTWNGFPLICLIITKVMKITRRITGIVHATRLTMNLSMGAWSLTEREGQGARGALPFGACYFIETFVRSHWSDGLMKNPLTLVGVRVALLISESYFLLHQLVLLFPESHVHRTRPLYASGKS